MNDFYIFFNIGMSIFMLLLGTKIYVPKFKSEKAKERFYKLKYFFILSFKPSIPHVHVHRLSICWNLKSATRNQCARGQQTDFLTEQTKYKLEVNYPSTHSDG